MDASEKGITSQNVFTIVLILLSTGIIVYWVPNIFLWISEKPITQTSIDLQEKKKELRSLLQQIEMLQDHELPLIYTDSPKQSTQELISHIKALNHFDAYRVWLNPHDIEVKIYFDEYLLQKLYLIRNTESSSPFDETSYPSQLQFSIIIEPYPNKPLSKELLPIITSTKTLTFLLDPHSPYALQQSKIIGQSFQDIITNHQESTDFFPILPYSTISLAKKRLSLNHSHKLLVGYQHNRNDFLYLNTHLSKEERWGRCITHAKSNDHCFLYLHESELNNDILNWIQNAPTKNFAFVLEALKK